MAPRRTSTRDARSSPKIRLQLRQHLIALVDTVQIENLTQASHEKKVVPTSPTSDVCSDDTFKVPQPLLDKEDRINVGGPHIPIKGGNLRKVPCGAFNNKPLRHTIPPIVEGSTVRSCQVLGQVQQKRTALVT